MTPEEDKIKITDLLINVLMYKYKSEIERKNRLEDKGFRYSLIILLSIIPFLISLLYFKLPSFITIIFSIISALSFAISILSLNFVCGIKDRVEADILSQWDALYSVSYSTCTQSIKNAMLDAIKDLETKNNELSHNVSFLVWVTTIMGCILFIYFTWRICYGGL